MPELPPLELAGPLLLALALAVFLGLAFEEVYKREERSRRPGSRSIVSLAPNELSHVRHALGGQ
jgi:hypothetical protein